MLMGVVTKAEDDPRVCEKRKAAGAASRLMTYCFICGCVGNVASARSEIITLIHLFLKKSHNNLLNDLMLCDEMHRVSSKKVTQ